MQAAPARYVSVSELYSTDEVELLLDEIRELEPTSCRGEDVQAWADRKYLARKAASDLHRASASDGPSTAPELSHWELRVLRIMGDEFGKQESKAKMTFHKDFEIAGSGCGAGGGGGRSPAGTEATERSWDSHAQYRRAPAARARALAPLYCRLRHLRSARGAASLAVVLCAAAAAACVWAAVGLRAAQLPLAARVQLLQLAALSSVLLHAVLLVMHVTGLSALMPIDWNKLGMWTSVWSALSLLLGGALTLHAVLCAPEYRWAPAHIASLLYSACGLGFGGACASGALVGCASRAGGCGRGGCGRWGRRGGGGPPPERAAYRAVPAAPPPHENDAPL